MIHGSVFVCSADPKAPFDKLGVVEIFVGEVPPSGAGDFGLGPKVTKSPPKPKVSDFLSANLAGEEIAFKH